MNIFLWILQSLLSLHTLTGAFWKFSHSAEETMPSLSAIPSLLWTTLGVLEILASIALILPIALNRHRILTSIAALFIVLEMVLYCILHFVSGATDHSSVGYWLIVAVLSGTIAYFRCDKIPGASK